MENKNTNKTKRPTIKELEATIKELETVIEGQKETIKNQDNTIKNLSDTFESRVVAEIRDRIIKKDRQVAQIEQDYEDTIANKGVIIDGLNYQIKMLTNENEILSAELKKRTTWGLYYKLFGKVK